MSISIATQNGLYDPLCMCVFMCVLHVCGFAYLFTGLTALFEVFVLHFAFCVV